MCSNYIIQNLNDPLVKFGHHNNFQEHDAKYVQKLSKKQDRLADPVAVTEWLDE